MSQTDQPVSREWLTSFALLGSVQSGLAPILLPITAGSGARAGLIYGSFALAGLAAPVLGRWGDHQGRSRAVLIGGLAVGSLAGVGLAFVVWTQAVLPLAMAAAFVLGLGVTSAATAGSAVAIEAEPPSEADSVIGAVQAWSSAGQVAGLIVAGLLAQRAPAIAFLIAAVALAGAAMVTAMRAPMPMRAIVRAAAQPRRAVGGEAATNAAGHGLHLPRFGALFRGDIGHLLAFLGPWALSYTATNAVSVLFPVAMVRLFHLPATIPAVAYAIGIGVSLLVYGPATHWAHRAGAGPVLRAGLAARVLPLVVLGIAAPIGGMWAAAACLIAFAVSQAVWPLLNVGANAMAIARLPHDRGEALGLLNASSSAAAVLGSLAGGAIAAIGGFGLLSATGAVAVIAAWGLLWLQRTREPVRPVAKAVQNSAI